MISLLWESLPDPMVIKLSSMSFVLIFQKTQSRNKHHSDWFQGSPLFLRPSLYCFLLFTLHESLWSWSYGSLIYNYMYLCNQCLSPLKLWVRISLRQDKVCQWLVKGRLFSPDTPVSTTNKTKRHNITEILLKVLHHNTNPNPEPEKL